MGLECIAKMQLCECIEPLGLTIVAMGLECIAKMQRARREKLREGRSSQWV